MMSDPKDDLDAARERTGLAEVAIHSQRNVLDALGRLKIQTADADRVMALLERYLALMRAEELRLSARAKEHAASLLASIASSVTTLREIVLQLRHDN